MITDIKVHLATVLLLLYSATASPAELRLSEGTNLSADVSPTDGRVVIDLLGSLWAVPARGGDARRLLDPSLQARRPRWSPDGSSILFESRLSGGRSLWHFDPASEALRRLTPAGVSEHDGAWHPSGERIVFAAPSELRGVDLWERDLETGLQWRLTDHAGDESSPAWSADGRHLTYIRREQGRWYLMLRRFGSAPQILHVSPFPMHAPSWRPDNTLITFLAQDNSGQYSIYMAILSEPALIRPLVTGEDFFLSPVSWLDRTRMVYTADGVIRTRGFEDRESGKLPFSAGIGKSVQRAALADRHRPLPVRGTRGGTIIVRASRLFDGISDSYRRNVDIVIEDGLIKSVEMQRDRGDAIVVDVGDSTVMPGLIDTYAEMPADSGDALGPSLLTYGVTTLVTPDLAADDARTRWQSGQLPGPRMLVAERADKAPPERDPLRVRLVSIGDGTVSGGRRVQANAAAWRQRGVPLLATNWNAGLTYAADMLLGTATTPMSPSGRRYEDVRGMTGNGPLLLVSGLSDAATPGVAALRSPAPGPRLNLVQNRGASVGNTPAVVVGSRPSGLPPGLATQAELLALRASGLPAHDVLRAANGAAADALGAGTEIGRIDAGARADLILVAGDPLQDIADVSQVIAVVRDGHFYSAASLRELAESLTVE